MRVRAGLAWRVVRVAVACAVGVAGVGLWAGPALAVQCPSRATQCEDWAKVPGQGWMTDVVCPEHNSHTREPRVRNLTENKLVLAVKNIDCYDWSNTGNPSQITGQVVDPGETRFFPMEQSAAYNFTLGVFIRDGSELRLRGKVRMSSDRVYGQERVRTDNFGQTINSRIICARTSLGEDPQRTESSTSFTQRIPGWKLYGMVTVYSDGENLYAVTCRDV